MRFFFSHFRLSCLVFLSLYGTSLAHAETWTHLFRDTDIRVSPTDMGPYDEYLDTDYIGFEGEWTLIRTKKIYDDPANEFHGKLELLTWAISCRKYKVGQKDYKEFLDLHDIQPRNQQTSSSAEIERFARPIKLLNKDSVATIHYLYACMGVPPEMWEEAKQKMTFPK